MTTSNNEWYNEWQRMVQRMTMSDNKWQRVATSSNEWSFRLILVFFQIKEVATTKHPKENSLNIEEDLWRRPTELRAEASP